MITVLCNKEKAKCEVKILAALLSQVDDAVEVIEMKEKALAVSLTSLSPKELHLITLDTGANKSFCNSQLGKLL